MEQRIKAMEEIYNATFDRTIVYVIMKCGKVHDVEDIVQDTYTELLQVLIEKGSEYIRVPEDFVMQLAKSKVYHYYSEKERERGCVFVEDYEILEQEDMPGIVNIGQNVEWEDSLINKLTAQEAMEYISGKDELTKEIFYQHYFEDKTLKEIAEKCGVKETTIKNHLYRMLKELRGLKKLWCILMIILLGILLVKPLYSWAEDIITKLKNISMNEETRDTVALGSAYRTYKPLIDSGSIPRDVCININGKDFTIDDLEEIWEQNLWLEDLNWDNTIVSGDSTEENIWEYDIYLNQPTEVKEEKGAVETEPTVIP